VQSTRLQTQLERVLLELMDDSSGSRSGLSYTTDGPLEAFVHYIYAEYWADDLQHDRFVPEVCIRSHFTSDVVWEYGGAARLAAIPAIGRYHGHDGIAAALDAFGRMLKVTRWEARSIVLTPTVEGECTAFIDLSAEYEIRESGRVLALDEVHVLQILHRGPTDEPQVASVRIHFDEMKLLQHLPKPTNSMIVLICGPSGCGKSTLAKALADEQPAVVVNQDTYFMSEFTAYSVRQSDAHESPASVDWNSLRCNVVQAAAASQLVIVEGHVVACNDELVAMADLCVVLRCTRETGRDRRVHRRERPPEELAELSQYYDTWVWPAFERYAAPALANLMGQSQQNKGKPVCMELDVSDGRPVVEHASEVQTQLRKLQLH